MISEVTSNYDKWPVIAIQEPAVTAAEGWEQVCAVIGEKVRAINAATKIIALECYQGVLDEELYTQLQQYLPGRFIDTREYMYPEAELKKKFKDDITEDAIFGYITRGEMKDFFDPAKVQALRAGIHAAEAQMIYIYGPGASLLPDVKHLLVYFDMPRWEIQLRFRNNEVSNLGCHNRQEKASLQYKQAFFVDWRVCDKHKKTLMHTWDLVVDTTKRGQPKIVDGPSFNKALLQLVHRPFRVVPFFDPGPWGGQWMKEYCDLDRNEKNFAWCFDCVPEENSLLLNINGITIETPSINLVFLASRALLGEAVQARFGDEFPIRFDFLDTMGGGNLSLQVHPYTEYIREHFGMDYTQDESYYLLDAGDDACVYLGLKEDTQPEEMLQALKKANSDGTTFDAEQYVAKWPVKKHDHILIPAGTVHCSGANSMVLEISATPFIFTFKLWDWGRMGLDGKPRPINIKHGEKVIDWAWRPAATRKELVNTITPVAEGDGWKEERTGLHQREFIETRRHWFTKEVTHHTNGAVNVLNLVEGKEAVVKSPSGAFEPFVVHYAETFIIPAGVTSYTITPHGEGAGTRCATIKAFVRTNP